jgi:tetratricopeptide (TPR) repeat protein
VSIQMTGLKVFIACPGGLEAERRLFRDAIREHNDDDANDRGINFMAAGWEYTLAGAGRPQSLINIEVERSDYCLLVLWDRWGSNTGKYSSGTEEEYMVARECLEPANRPMRDIVVLFKGVDERQLSDPGAELQKVLAFKQSLEEEKALLYSTFDSTAEFEHEVRRHLQRWTRDFEQFATPQQPTGPPPPVPNQDPPRVAEELVGPPGSELVDRAEALAATGRTAEAESLFARAVAEQSDDPTTLASYAIFLRRIGRLSHAAAIDERMLRSGERSGEIGTVVSALANLAVTKRKQGELEEARHLLERAIELAAKESNLNALAFLHDNLGLTLRRLGDFEEAEEHHREALRIREASGDRRGMASAFNNLGYLLRERGSLDEALTMHERALELFRDVDDPRGEASTLGNIGAVRENLGDLPGAQASYLSSLSINETLNSSDGQGMNFAQLSHLFLITGDLESAETAANRCLVVNEQSGNREGIAGALHALGRVELARGEYRESIGSFQSAHDIYSIIGLRLGRAGTLVDMAIASNRGDDHESAVAILERAKEIAAGMAHVKLDEEIRQADQELAGDAFTETD